MTSQPLLVYWFTVRGPSCPAYLSVVTFSRFRRSSSQQWWTGSQLSLARLSCWTRTAAWSPPWSITSHITSRTWRDTTSKRTKGKREDCPKKLWIFSSEYLPRCIHSFYPRSPGTQSSSSTTSWSRPWMHTGMSALWWNTEDICTAALLMGIITIVHVIITHFLLHFCLF